MKSRVTITLDPTVHRQAQSEARRRGTTLSGWVEALLARQIKSGDSLVERLVGSGELRDSPPGKDPLYDRLKARHVRS